MAAGKLERVHWMPFDLEWKPASPLVEHCCASMSVALEHRCDQHKDPFECPDTALVFHEPFGEYGVPVRDGTMSYYLIAHCPWCGVRLPPSQRDRWFDATDALEAAGASPFDPLPERFLTAAWRT